MSEYADKMHKDENVPHRSFEQQNNSGSTAQLSENSPNAILQREQQEAVNNSPKVQQLKAYQEMADNSPRVQQFKAYQEMVDNSPRVQQFKAYQEMADSSPKVQQFKAYQEMADNYTPNMVQRKGYLGKEELKTELTGNKPNIVFASGANAEVVTDYSLKIIEDIGEKANISSLRITSTYRNPSNQIRIMYGNLIGGNKAVEKQQKLYGMKGDKVIAAFLKAKKERNATPETIKAAMLSEAEDVDFVSNHSKNNYSQYNVIDISYSSLSSKQYKDLKRAALDDSRISVVKGKEEGDKALHIEIPQPKEEFLYDFFKSQGDFYVERQDWWIGKANEALEQGRDNLADDFIQFAEIYKEKADKTYREAEIYNKK